MHYICIFDHEREICHIFMQNLYILHIWVAFFIYQIFFSFIVFYTCNSINTNGTYLMITPSRRLLIWGSIATPPPSWMRALITLVGGVHVNSKSNEGLMHHDHDHEREREILLHPKPWDIRCVGHLWQNSSKCNSVSTSSHIYKSSSPQRLCLVSTWLLRLLLGYM